MLLINLSGGPGSGKSTTASYLFAKLKYHGVKAELVGEHAKDVVYDRTLTLLENQVLITGFQFQRIKRLHDSNCEVAISDSPLIFGAMYGAELPYAPELAALIRKLERYFPYTKNVRVRRVKPYTSFGRLQDEQAARAFDEKSAAYIGKFDFEINGDEHGANMLYNKIVWEWRP